MLDARHKMVEMASAFTEFTVSYTKEEIKQVSQMLLHMWHNWANAGR